MKVAKFIRRMEGWRGNARLYRVSPTQVEDVHGRVIEFDFIVVSAAVVPFFGPECYMFASDAEGEPLLWGELDGSERGHMSHVQVLQAAGYVVEP